jgi:hypothetical protein
VRNGRDSKREIRFNAVRKIIRAYDAAHNVRLTSVRSNSHLSLSSGSIPLNRRRIMEDIRIRAVAVKFKVP